MLGQVDIILPIIAHKEHAMGLLNTTRWSVNASGFSPKNGSVPSFQNKGAPNADVYLSLWFSPDLISYGVKSVKTCLIRKKTKNYKVTSMWCVDQCERLSGPRLSLWVRVRLLMAGLQCEAGHGAGEPRVASYNRRHTQEGGVWGLVCVWYHSRDASVARSKRTLPLLSTTKWPACH